MAGKVEEIRGGSTVISVHNGVANGGSVHAHSESFGNGSLDSLLLNGGAVSGGTTTVTTTTTTSSGGIRNLSQGAAVSYSPVGAGGAAIAAQRGVGPQIQKRDLPMM